MSKLIDLSGQKFGRLTVVRRAEGDEVKPYKSKCAQWLCECECGNTVVVQTGNLKSGNTTSCGCYKRDVTAVVNRTHGKSGTALYNVYVLMKRRCNNPKMSDYKWYGGKGITVCDEWMESFESFYSWALSNGYEKGLTIDRVDPKRNYCPDNCRWITIEDQQSNRSNNRCYTYNGDTLTISEWARRVGLKEATVRHRLDAGWSFEDAITVIPNWHRRKAM